jgi:hypothetical protein
MLLILFSLFILALIEQLDPFSVQTILTQLCSSGFAPINKVIVERFLSQTGRAYRRTLGLIPCLLSLPLGNCLQLLQQTSSSDNPRLVMMCNTAVRAPQSLNHDVNVPNLNTAHSLYDIWCLQPSFFSPTFTPQQGH